MIIKRKESYCFELAMEVRDYELDCEQIVNNANYLHYMEHTRHKFCTSIGISFLDMHRSGIDCVARKIEIEYIDSLRDGDIFHSCLDIERHGACFIFHQDICKDDIVCARAKVTIAVIKDGKLSRGEELMPYLSKYLSDNK